MAIPNVCQDNVTDAARRLGCQFLESFFFRASLEAGYGTRSEDKARELHVKWTKEGYKALPDFVKNFALAVCDGKHLSEPVSERI